MRRLVAAIGIWAGLMGFGLVWADPADVDDLGLWVPVILELPVNQKWGAWLQLEPRLGNNIQDINGLIVLPGVDYKVNKVLSLQTAYGWYPVFRPDFRSEQRLLQQATLQKQWKRVNASLRARIEERWFDDTNGASIRNRYQLRAELPIRSGPWYVVGLDEVFFNLNDQAKGPRQGLDQNRIFLGLGRRFNSQMRAEAGYQLQWVNRRDQDQDQANHVVLIRINYRLR